jgi:hypothetical protein
VRPGKLNFQTRLLNQSQDLCELLRVIQVRQIVYSKQQQRSLHEVSRFCYLLTVTHNEQLVWRTVVAEQDSIVWFLPSLGF